MPCVDAQQAHDGSLFVVLPLADKGTVAGLLEARKGAAQGAAHVKPASTLSGAGAHDGATAGSDAGGRVVPSEDENKAGGGGDVDGEAEGEAKKKESPAATRCDGLPESVARGLFAQLVAALLHCHAHGVAHMDVRPSVRVVGYIVSCVVSRTNAVYSLALRQPRLTRLTRFISPPTYTHTHTHTHRISCSSPQEQKDRRSCS